MNWAHRMGVRLAAAVAILAVAAYMLLLRDRYYHLNVESRSQVGAAWQEQGFSVAVVWPRDADGSFVDGVRLALDDTNASGGPLAHRIRLRIVDEHGDDTAMATARAVVSHDDVVAVLGHEFSGSAVGASVVYEQHGVLFLASTATSPRLTEHNFNFVFRLTPDDRVIAQAIADFAKERHFKKVGVVYARTEDGEEASDHVISGLRDAGIDVALVRSYMPKARPRRVDYRPLAAAFKEQPLDAVVLADELPRAAGVIDDFVRMGYTGPILATDKLDSVDLSPEAGPAADSVYVASAVDPTYDGPAYRAFRDRFRRRWGRDPGYRASQGYEAMHLLIDAVLTSRSADPIVLATTLRTRRWEGLFGRYSFDEHGEIVGRQVSIKHMQHGRFETVERITTAGEQQKEPERQDQQED